jgi:hypothetical protein
MSRLIADSQNPSLSHSQRLALLKTVENAQSKTFVDTYILYGNTCDQLAMVYAESGDLNKSIEWCKKALKVVMAHFPHDSIEVAQETLKLAGLYFNKYVFCKPQMLVLGLCQNLIVGRLLTLSLSLSLFHLCFHRLSFLACKPKRP